MAAPLVCPACGTGGALTERFCPRCGSPLIHAPGTAERPSRRDAEAIARARKVHPPYADGEPVRVATAHNQPEAELVQALLLDAGIPSLARRSGGFDVPDFLAAGPRDILVPSSGLDAARELLGEPQAPRRLPEQRHPAWMRALAVTLTLTVLVAFAAAVAVPFFD